MVQPKGKLGPPLDRFLEWPMLVVNLGSSCTTQTKTNLAVDYMKQIHRLIFVCNLLVELITITLQGGTPLIERVEMPLILEASVANSTTSIHGSRSTPSVVIGQLGGRLYHQFQVKKLLTSYNHNTTLYFSEGSVTLIQLQKSFDYQLQQ